MAYPYPGYGYGAPMYGAPPVTTTTTYSTGYVAPPVSYGYAAPPVGYVTAPPVSVYTPGYGYNAAYSVGYGGYGYGGYGYGGYHRGYKYKGRRLGGFKFKW